jgi:hypothetical protein
MIGLPNLKTICLRNWQGMVALCRVNGDMREMLALLSG